MMTLEAVDGWKWQTLDSVSVKVPLGDIGGSNPAEGDKRGTMHWIKKVFHYQLLLSQVQIYMI